MPGEAVCLASGPSLNAEDVEMVRQWRLASPDRFVMVANTTFRIAPWADALFALDNKWWVEYGEEVMNTFAGLKFCTIGDEALRYASRVNNRKRFMTAGNSGAAIVAYCASGDFDKIVMLGFDCKKTGGKSHWHGDHPVKPGRFNLGNCASMPRWPLNFAQVRAHYRAANIVNASRVTSLKVFPKVSLEEALGIQQVVAA